MIIWYLIVWQAATPMEQIEAGQYQSRLRCQQAAHMMLPLLIKEKRDRDLRWKCTTSWEIDR